jgi:transcriptional regulator of acetoin/glycerol metabolism
MWHNSLSDYVVLAAAQSPQSLIEAIEQRSVGPLVAEALLRMSEDVHPPEDRARRCGCSLVGREDVAAALAQSGGNATRAAVLLGISRTTLYRVRKEG